MDIEAFYDGDPRRRAGQDRSYGTGWTGTGDEDHTYDLYFNDGSGELYLMAKPHLNPLVGYVGYDIVGVAEHLIHPRHIQAKTGGAHPAHHEDPLMEDLTVEVLGTYGGPAEVDQLLAGWQQAVDEPGSLSWLRERLAGAPH